MKLYKTLIRPIVCHEAEIWSLSKADANRLKIFERRLVRKIYRSMNKEGK